MNKYNVFEVNGDNKNRIATVEANNLEEARNIAHKMYGAPIKVQEVN